MMPATILSGPPLQILDLAPYPLVDLNAAFAPSPPSSLNSRSSAETLVSLSGYNTARDTILRRFVRVCVCA